MPSAKLLRTLACLTLSLGTSLTAQSIYGTLRGIVTDKAGAVVQSAVVVLTNEGTNASRSTVTNSSGEYVFGQIVPANYTVGVEMKGFKKSERKNVVLNAQNTVDVDVILEVGNVTESISVTEEVPLIETATASQGQTIDRQKLVDLPNLGRNPYMFSKLAPNVAQVGNPAYMRMQDQSGSSQISVAGGPVRGNNYLIDGVPITDLNNRAIIIASLESVQEMKVQSNTYDAEIGRSGGGMFNTLLRSGTNQYHGSLGGYIRQTDWLANAYFDRGAGRPIVDQPFRNYYGSIGGPIWIPKVYNGKDKTFFWGVFEGYRDTQGNSGVTAVPTALERVGDFSATKNTIIYDPSNLVNGNRVAFPGNVIPRSRINPAGLGIASTFAAPNLPTTSLGALNTNYSGKLPSKADQKTIKFDHRLFNWWTANISYLKYNSLEPGETWFPDLPSTPEQWRLDRRVDATQINSTMTLNPTTVLSLRYGFNRFPNYSFTKYQNVDFGALGFSSAFVGQTPTKNFPTISFQNFYPGDNMGAGGTSSYVPNSKSLNGALSKFIGKHTLKAGADYRKMETTGSDLGDGGGTYSFENRFTRQSATSNSGGADIADLLLGYPTSASTYVSTKLFEYVRYFSGFVQDDIRLRNNLTLNIGMRWEHETGLQEKYNNLIVGFNPSALNSLSSVVGVPVKGAVQFAGQAGAKTSTGNPTNAKLSPRFGVAYQFNPKTTLRGGYGIFWAPTIALNSPYLSEGYSATTQPLYSADGGITPAITLSNPFPNGKSQPVGNALGDRTGLGIGLTVFDPNAKSTWIEQFSVDVQRELPMGVALSVAYVGSRSHNLVLGTNNLNQNQLLPSFGSLGSGLNKTVNNPYYVPGGSGIVGSKTISQGQLLRPFPAFANINYQFSDQNKAKYDSMAIRAQKRMGKGLSLLAAFTWAKAYDESSGGPGNNLNGGSAGPQNVYDLNSEYSNSNFIAPLRFSMSASYELPFGKGKQFLGGVNKLTDLALGGWSINLVNTTQSGYYLNITSSSNLNSSLYTASQRPNATGVNPATSGSVGSRINSGWLNPAAFSQAPAFTFGNVSRTLPVLGPGLYDWNASLFKSFSITEKFKAQFRAEFLNATNTPNFRGPGTAFGSGSFGQITSQANFSRMVQLGARIYF